MDAGWLDLLFGISQRDNVDPGEGWDPAGRLGEGGGRDGGTSRAVGFSGFTVQSPIMMLNALMPSRERSQSFSPKTPLHPK